VTIEHWADDNIGFDGYHYNVVPGIHCRDRVMRRRFDVPGNLEYDIDVALRRDLAVWNDGCFSVSRDVVCSADGTGRDETIGFPIRTCRSCACAFDIEIGESTELNARHEAQLRENHRSEFAGADLRNTNRAALFRSGGKHA
jgi:hypothetical protein